MSSLAGLQKHLACPHYFELGTYLINAKLCTVLCKIRILQSPDPHFFIFGYQKASPEVKGLNESVAIKIPFLRKESVEKLELVISMYGGRKERAKTVSVCKMW